VEGYCISNFHIFVG